ncbi:carbohydrate ABC transporter permease [Microbacterium sp. RU33B]|uniref:carbohydrate ABC transporter permease n=1 Tax=Microbacterium sp. RU33B TaxID=1907390 RepID=UPI0009784669|nr:sugar ABC transporter permease [Microbacterium sp. RU33B]
MGRPRTRGGARRVLSGPAAVALLFLLPALVALVVLRLAPAVVAFVDSLFRTTLLGGTTFAGFGNYLELFANPDFQNSIGVTLLFTLLVNPLQIAAAFLLAVLFTKRAAGSRVWRSLVILPIAVPPAVSAVIWSVIYRPDGLANAFLAVFGIPPQPFLTSPQQALLSIMILLSWIGVGYWMMFLIAGINDIPTSYYEAASLDGASSWRQLWSITFPLVRRPLAFVLVADTVSNLLVFAPVQILTKGGPNGSTNLLMYDIFTRAYTFGDINKAQAEVMILVLITVVVVAIQFRLLRAED